MTKRQLLGSAAVAVVLIAGVTVATVAAASTTPTALLPPTVSLADPTATQQTATRILFRMQAGSVQPVRYVYQLNFGPLQVVDASNGGPASAIVFPDSFVNQLQVTARAADGSTSSVASLRFIAVAPSPFADQDLNGDGKPDLLTVGGTAGLASGLWQAAGHDGTGRVDVPAVNIGINGNGFSGDRSPADFDGAQVITGKFTGSSFEDFLVYYPAGPFAGAGAVLQGNGRGAVLDPRSGNETNAPQGTFADFNGDNPLQIVNGYNSDGSNSGYPALFGIVGDPANGYTLDIYPELGGTLNYDVPAALALPTPTGGADWQNWRLASKLLPNGTALLLWNQGTGALYLWESVTYNPGTGTLSYTAYQLSSNWQQGAQLSTLELTDFDGDGVPDIWAVTPAGDATPFTISNLSATGPATIRAGDSQHLS
jgi:hypothetical protein